MASSSSSLGAMRPSDNISAVPRRRERAGTIVAAIVAAAFVVGSGLGVALALGGALGAAPRHAGPAASHPLSASGAVPAVSSSPLAKVATLTVGGLPEFAAYDALTGEVYVPNWANGNVSVVNGTHIVGTVSAGVIPFSATYDPINHYVYVVNEFSNSITVIDGTVVVTTLHVGAEPRFASYDAANQMLYVDNTHSANVTVINGTTIVANVHVGTNPQRPVVGVLSGGGGGGGGWGPAAGSGSSVIYVPNGGSANVTVLGGTSGFQNLGSTAVGMNPQFGTWDPSNVWLYVPNNNSSTVSVLSSLSPFSVLYTVHVGTHPFSATYNATTQKVFVVNYGSDNVSEIGGALVNHVIASTHVGSGPEFLAQLPGPANAFVVPNTLSGNVSVIVGTTVTQTFTAGTFPVYGTVDPKTDSVYVQNFESANMTVLGPASPTVQVTFKAHGLLSGAAWSVTTGSPTKTYNGTTSGKVGEITVAEPIGAITYSFGEPAGYAVSKVTGPGLPSQSTVNVSAKTTLTVTFALLETMTFSELGLPNGTSWGISLHSSLPHGGPGPQNGTTTNSSLTFTLVGGSWKYVVSVPTDYKAKPAKGSVGIHTAPRTKTIKFALVTEKVIFSETGLHKGTMWGVNVSGPFPCDVQGTTAKLTCLLPSGNYTYTVQVVVGENATPPSGSLSIVAPGPAQHVSITYAPSGARPLLFGGGTAGLALGTAPSGSRW